MHIAPRHAWLNTFVGVLDAAFVLTDEELFFCQDIVNRLLATLNIPDRGDPVALPALVASEASAGLWAVQLHGGRETVEIRVPRLATAHDTQVSLEAWRSAFVGMLRDAYPDLDPYEVVQATAVFDDLLLALGIPGRAARFLPEDVVRAHWAVERAS